jgi:phosphatidylglycerol:prolipoprotein diacylglycerol transferase
MIPFIHIGWFALPTFGLMVAVAMLASSYVLRADLTRRGIGTMDSGTAEKLVALPCLAGLIGAKLYHELETPREFFADPWHHLFNQFGFAWFGGLLAGLLTYIWLSRRETIPVLAALDAGSPAAALGYGIGRIGCLLSGDGDYGVPTSLPWGMRFPEGLVPTNLRVHPTPLYELFASIAIAWFLWRLGERRALGTISPGRERRPGSVFAAFLMLTGLARFLVEFIRINPKIFFGLTNAQLASVCSVLLGSILWVRLSRARGSAW